MEIGNLKNCAEPLYFQNLVPEVTLNNGVKIPQLGLRTYRLAEGEETYNVVLTELKSGYRHVDTAHEYRNERSVGRARKDSVIDRVECWFPLGGRESGGLILRDPVLNEIAAKRGKSVAQIILRWHMQKGFLAVPGSSNPQHIKDNINIFDFSLSDDEMAKINALNKEDRVFKVTLEEKQKNYSKIILED